MAQNDYTSIMGHRVALSGVAGSFPTCSKCGHQTGIVRKGISTHPGQLACDGCGKHLSWIGASHMDAILASASLPPRKAGAA